MSDVMLAQRIASVERKTAETDVRVEMGLDGSGSSRIDTGIGFFDHMLTLFAKHGLLDLVVEARGDLQVDGHHTVEDVGIVMGQALMKAASDRTGISRYGHAYVPMDEALVRVVADVSGRPFLVFNAELGKSRIGRFDTELLEEFLRAFSVHGGLTLHVEVLAGRNLHHIVEAVFKALGRALSDSLARDPRVVGIPSTKGVL